MEPIRAVEFTPPTIDFPAVDSTASKPAEKSLTTFEPEVQQPWFTKAMAFFRYLFSGETDGPLGLRAQDSGVTIDTADGYKVEVNGKEQSWTIHGPSGESTRIWGDPHVDESDGTRWDFYEQSSFLFGENKVTVETVDAGNGTTYSDRITVYSGRERITVGGIAANKPTVEAERPDAQSDDAVRKDGTTYTQSAVTGGRFDWVRQP